MSVLSTDKREFLQSAQYFYGCPYKDRYMLHTPESLPLYRHLARKMFLYYAREHYNPHTIAVSLETYVRNLIKGLVEYKISYRTKAYDWEWIDHFFRKLVSDYYDLSLPYDLKRIEQGFAPEFTAPIVPDFGRPN